MQPEGQQNRIIMRCFVIEIRILHNMCINGYHKIKKTHNNLYPLCLSFTLLSYWSYYFSGLNSNSGNKNFSRNNCKFDKEIYYRKK